MGMLAQDFSLLRQNKENWRHISTLSRMLWGIRLRDLTRITQVNRNYLWSGSEEFKKPPHISWKHSCQSKNKGGLGIKDYDAWNKAAVAKLVWDITDKKDVLWVKWIHGKYIRGKDWWDYSPPPDRNLQSSFKAFYPMEVARCIRIYSGKRLQMDSMGQNVHPQALFYNLGLYKSQTSNQTKPSQIYSLRESTMSSLSKGARG
ncbi:hypothetical protein Cgig2_012541 [Carnegiea gigantea]|uniref:Uncharacterized protein n=1 Tax=Carnegiea gigantea TaxID=171969 RepID=A0A9Q1GJY9_9CARY|nr:hypothetical protein Cgig2_012541 [Carnegiea gigantea]